MSWEFAGYCEEPGPMELLAGEQPCAGCASGAGLEVDNYTYNVSPMFVRAFAGTPIEKDGIRGLNGMTAQKAVPILAAAIAYFQAHEAELMLLNPHNGWGNYDGALRLLFSLHRFGVKHPRCYFTVH